MSQRLTRYLRAGTLRSFRNRARRRVRLYLYMPSEQVFCVLHGRLAQWESTALTTQSARTCDQGHFAKCLVSAYLVSVGDIRRHPVTGI